MPLVPVTQTPLDHLYALVEHARRVIAMNPQATLTQQELKQLVEAFDNVFPTK